MRNAVFVVLVLFTGSVHAQKNRQASTALPFDTTITNQLTFRCIGPWRGGRSCTVCGDLSDKNVFYMGATGGGVWKTQDGGQNWKNISDGFFGGSIGAVAVSESDPTILYAGTGESTLRGNVSEGNGIWKTDNGGRTWQNMGLTDSRHIMRIVIHPKDPDIVYCAALGHLFGKNTERGIYKSTDGGTTWKRVLYVNDSVGAADIVMDPGDPDILLATFWNVKRTSYSFESGGPGSGIYKSTDGGNTWTDITRNPGLPKDTIGIIRLAICPSDPLQYYAMVEAKDGGLFVSKDGGKTWEKMNDESKIRQRAWYFSCVKPDPENPDIVYVLNVEMWKSTDGGKSFSEMQTPHGDHHDLWIDPADPKRMILADDGGAQVSFDGGENWSSYYNQPTAQIYRVSTDNDVPYRILGAQQDNSTLRIAHRSKGGEIGRGDWQPTAGFESGYVVADPTDPDIVYGGNYSGFLNCVDHRTGDRKTITVWPEDPIGQGGEFLKYRFQWNYPIFFSPNDPHELYAAGNVLFKTTDGGLHWTAISPDLTTNDKSRQKSSGGIITKDNTGVEIYCTIFTAAESPAEKDVICTGSDDGLVYITRDGGAHWDNVTPPDLPQWTMINCIEADRFEKGKFYFAATRYKLDDNAPYLYVTTDYGKSWKKITDGITADISKDNFTRVIREDAKRPGLLYCGTEKGLYISYDDGAHWFPFQCNIPPVPVTDITMKDNDLIIATQGRGFWILDDAAVLQEMSPSVSAQHLKVFPIHSTYLLPGYRNANPVNAGMNPHTGVVIQYILNSKPDTSQLLSISIYDPRDTLVRKFSTQAKDKDLKIGDCKKGLNLFEWDMQYPAGVKIDDVRLWNGVPGSITAAPGNYYAVVSYGKDSLRCPFTILRDPNSKATDEDYTLQFDFLIQIRDTFNTVENAVKECRALQSQINTYISRLGKDAPSALKDSANAIVKKLAAVEDALNESRNKAGEDMLNYGIKLNDKLAGLYNVVSAGNFRPTQQSRDVFAGLCTQWDTERVKLRSVRDKDIPALNAMIRQSNLPVIIAE